MKLLLSLILLLATLSAAARQAGNEYPVADAHTLIPYRKGALWGYAGADGRLIVEPRFEEAGLLRHGRGRVRLKGKYGFINEFGSIIIQPKYDTATEFGEFAIVTRRKKKMYIDRYGRVVKNPQEFAVCGGDISVSRPVFTYTKDGKVGLATRERIVYDSLLRKKVFRYDTLPGLYDDVRMSVHGYIALRLNDKWALADPGGRLVLPFEYDRIEFNPAAHPGDELSCYSRICQNRRWGLLDAKGAVAVTPAYEKVQFCDQQVFWVKPFGRSGGYIDRHGRAFFED